MNGTKPSTDQEAPNKQESLLSEAKRKLPAPFAPLTRREEGSKRMAVGTREAKLIEKLVQALSDLSYLQWKNHSNQAVQGDYQKYEALKIEAKETLASLFSPSEDDQQADLDEQSPAA